MPNLVLTEHEWRIRQSKAPAGGIVIYCIERGCNLELIIEQAEAMLNEYADTKQQLLDCAEIVLCKDKEIYKLKRVRDYVEERWKESPESEKTGGYTILKNGDFTALLTDTQGG